MIFHDHYKIGDLTGEYKDHFHDGRSSLALKRWNHHDQGKAWPFEIGLIRKSRENQAKTTGRILATLCPS